MISERNVYAYCCEDISKIDNYEKAVADKTHVWACHHRAEILPCGRFSKQDLLKFGLYYNQPADRLIFLTSAEHRRLHYKGQKLPEETKQKISKSLTGKKLSIDHKQKISESQRGRKNPNAVAAMRKARLGSHNSESANEANRRAHLGKRVWLDKHHTEATKKKLSEIAKIREARKRQLSKPS